MRKLKHTIVWKLILCNSIAWDLQIYDDIRALQCVIVYTASLYQIMCILYLPDLADLLIVKNPNKWWVTSAKRCLGGYRSMHKWEIILPITLVQKMCVVLKNVCVKAAAIGTKNSGEVITVMRWWPAVCLWYWINMRVYDY